MATNFSVALQGLRKQSQAVSGRQPSRGEVAGVVEGVAATAGSRLTAKQAQKNREEQLRQQASQLAEQKRVTNLEIQEADRLREAEKQQNIGAGLAFGLGPSGIGQFGGSEEGPEGKDFAGVTPSLGTAFRGTVRGARTGATVGSFVGRPAVGAAVGGVIGLVSSFFGGPAGPVGTPDSFSESPGSMAGGDVSGGAEGGISYLCTKADEYVGLTSENWNTLSRFKRYVIKNHKDVAKFYFKNGHELAEKIDKKTYENVLKDMIIPVMAAFNEDEKEKAYKIYRDFTLKLFRDFMPLEEAETVVKEDK